MPNRINNQMKQYNDTDRRLHLLCQIIAKANRTFVPAKEDDSHTNLYFDSLGDRITGRWIEVNNDKLLFTITLSNLSVEVLNNSQQPVASYVTVGKMISEVEMEIEKDLPSWGLNKSGFREDLHFEIPEYSFVSEPVSSLDLEAIMEWKQFRLLANEACALLLGYAQSQVEIRIWPHHFDTGIYTDIKPNIGLGLGLAMEDEIVGAPYFYMSGYPKNGTIDYVALPEGSGWEWKISEEWNGAVLSIDELRDKSDTERKSLLSNYLREAYGWFVLQD